MAGRSPSGRATRPTDRAANGVSPNATALFEAIAHGDEHHRAWLKEAIAAYFAGLPAPPPRGRGNKEVLAEALSDALAMLGSPANDGVLALDDHDLITHTVILHGRKLKQLHAALSIARGDSR